MKADETNRMDLAGWPLPDAFLVELGRVSALWAALEALLMLSLSRLSGFSDPNNPVPFILVAHSSFPQRLDMLGTLCEQLTPQHPHLSDCSSVATKLRAAQRLRNRYLHNGLSPNPETGEIEITEGSARGKVKVSIERVSVADIQAASFEIHEAHRALAFLVFRTELPARAAAQSA